MSAVILRPEEPDDQAAIRALLINAFGGDAEAKLVDALRRDGDIVLSLVAERDGHVRGYVLFSRLVVRRTDESFPAVALAPLAVHPEHQREGIGTALVDEAHLRLQQEGERLSIVLGDPAYYDRFGYSHAHAAGFESAYQGEALQALAWENAPRTGRLEYAPPFSAVS